MQEHSCTGMTLLVSTAIKLCENTDSSLRIKAVFYHAGCPVCAGIVFVPAFMIAGQPFQINFGASLGDLK